MTKYLTCESCGNKFRKDEAPRVRGRPVPVCPACRGAINRFLTGDA